MYLTLFRLLMFMCVAFLYQAMKERAKAMFGFKPKNKNEKSEAKSPAVDYLRPFTNSSSKQAHHAQAADSDSDDGEPMIEMLDEEEADNPVDQQTDSSPTPTNQNQRDDRVLDGGVPIEELIDFDVPLDPVD
jgi:hypothetical protein